MNPAISVIVPVYNTEKYLRRCIDSILSQTFTDFELLLINDGSTDSSGEICDQYAAKDERIRVFHKENGGVSSARNVGLDEAKGEWIAFVDSDDYLLSNALDLITDLENEDFVICSYQRFIENQNPLSVIYESCRLNTQSLKRFYSLNLHTAILRTPWGKFFRKELIGNLRFNESIRVGEDTLFVIDYSIRVCSCKILDKVSYAYREYGVSFFSKYNLSVEEAIYTLTLLFDTYKKLDVYSVLFEKWIFLDYRLMCRESLNKRPSLWYDNAEVKRLYERIKKDLGWTFRIKYRLLSIPLFIQMNNIIKSNLR